MINVLDVEREAMQFDIMYLVFWEFEGVIIDSVIYKNK